MSNTSSLPTPFALPQRLEPALDSVRQHWLALRRGQADIPFTDDIKLSALSEAAADLVLIDVFERPVRFRFAVATPGITTWYGQAVEGMFADEIVPKPPLDFVLAQSSVTLESRAPTYYSSTGTTAYSRLMLPLWGDGHINGLLCAIA